MRKIGQFAVRASIAAIALSSCTSAFAQDAEVGAEDAVTEEDRGIVVTGSLIRRSNNTAVSPIVTVGAEAIKEAGTVNLNDALNQVPSFTTGGNAATGGQAGGGRATINLHGLGTNRNLVLLDGKRLPVSDISGNVDVNIVPESIVGGIDVITGGASAVYGSDAISGVVNFKTLRNFEGVKLDAQYNISERGDAAKLNASAAFGTKFAGDRGSLLAAFSYADQDPLDGSRRSFFFDKVPSGFIGFGAFVPSATNAPSAAAVTSLFNSYGVAGTRNPLGSNLGFNNDGTLFTQTGALNYRGPNGTQGYAVVAGNVRQPVGQQIQFLNALERKTAFVKGDYKFSDQITAYGQFLFVDLTVSSESGSSLTQFPTLTTIPVTNPFIPNDLRPILASRANPTAAFNWSARYVGVPDKIFDENYKVQQYLLGFKGDISSTWSYDVFGSYDSSKHTLTNRFAVLKSQVQRLLNAADGGNSLCAGGFNPFGDANARSLSAACLAFITTNAVNTEDLTQTQFQAQVNGELFDLGAGPVQIALLGSYRKNTYAFAPDANFIGAGVDAQGRSINIGAFSPGGNVESVVNTLPLSKVGISVKEVAAQIDIPLISDKPFFKELSIGAAGRISDYSTVGSVTTYQADARWRPVEELLFRGSYQRAVRAPNIGELFSPPQGSQFAIGTPPSALGDPCDVRSSARTGANGAQVAALCVAQGVPQAVISSYQFQTTATGQVVSGNLNLTPERATTFNFGAVFNAPSNDGIFGDFSLSVDYYNIRIKNVISGVPGGTVFSRCYNLDGSNPTFSATNEFCRLINRDTSTGQLSNISTPFLNLGSLETDGVEVQLHWGVPAPFIAESGELYVDSAIGWLNNYKVQLLPGTAFLDFTGISSGSAQPGSLPPRATPEWKALTTFGYQSDKFGFGLRWRYQGSLKDASFVTTPLTPQRGVSPYNLWDLFATVRPTDKMEFRFGVNNLLDRELPFVASNQVQTDTALYDVVGRSFYVGVKVGF